MEGNNPAGGDGDLFTGLGIPSGPLILVSQVEIPEAGQMDTVSVEQGGLDRVKKKVHQLSGFAFIDPQLVIQCCRQMRFGQSG
jgi:hypothetical protein